MEANQSEWMLHHSEHTPAINKPPGHSHMYESARAAITQYRRLDGLYNDEHVLNTSELYT